MKKVKNSFAQGKDSWKSTLGNNGQSKGLSPIDKTRKLKQDLIVAMKKLSK